MKKIIIAIIIFFLSFFIFSSTGHYFIALFMESRWNKVDPKTKEELESYLYFYNTKIINPTNSMWGCKYDLNDSEKMLQYQIMWDKNCPLDVVYDSNNNIKVIFTSYE